MNQLEQFIIKNVPNGEEELMKIINQDTNVDTVVINQSSDLGGSRSLQGIFEKSGSGRFRKRSKDRDLFRVNNKLKGKSVI